MSLQREAMKWLLPGDSPLFGCPSLHIPLRRRRELCMPNEASEPWTVCVVGGDALSEIVLAMAVGLFLDSSLDWAHSAVVYLV